jgi:hypothetical protein
MSFILSFVMRTVILRESNDPDRRMFGTLMMIAILFTQSFFRISKRKGL